MVEGRGGRRKGGSAKPGSKCESELHDRRKGKQTTLLFSPGIERKKVAGKAKVTQKPSSSSFRPNLYSTLHTESCTVTHH